MPPLSFALDLHSPSSNRQDRPSCRSDCGPFELHAAEVELGQLLEKIRVHEGEAVPAPALFKVVVTIGLVMLGAGIAGLGLAISRVIQWLG